MKDSPYIVDVTQPPEGPPSVIKKESFFGPDRETKESIKRGEQYDEYMKEYGIAFEHSPNRKE